MPFVNHKNSDIRVQSYYSLWLSKKCLLEKGVIPLLLDNIAESLFFNGAALGIVMRICANKPDLIEFVRTYEPRGGITKEYKNAISDFSQKSQEFVGTGGFFGLELRMRDWLFRMLAEIKLKE
jgi:hypothetical protein